MSCFIQKLIQPSACWDHGLFRILSSYWMSHFYLLKKSAEVLLYFGLDCGLLVFFMYSTHKPQSQEQLLTLPHFWSTVRRKRSLFVTIQPVIPTGRMARGIKRLRTLKCFQIFKTEIKKLKPIAVDALF